MRNGFRSTSLLRTSISPPTRDEDERDRRRRRRRRRRGGRRRSTPRPRRRPSRARARVARKRPTATIPSPHSSGWWCDRVFVAGRFLTRAGVRGFERPLDGLLPGDSHWACCFCGSVPYPPPHACRHRDRGRRSARRAGALRARRADRPPHGSVSVGHLRRQHHRRVPDRRHGRGARAALRGLVGAAGGRDGVPRRLHDVLDVLARHVPAARGGPHRPGGASTRSARSRPGSWRCGSG